MPALLAKHLEIRGKVQGVYFRESMRLEALRLGLLGWVRNRSDGSVEAFIQGEAAAVEELETWAGVGPPSADVSQVKSEKVSPDPTLKSFQRRETG